MFVWHVFFRVHDPSVARPRQTGHHFTDDIFKGIYLNEKIPISLKLVPKSPINNKSALVQIMARNRLGDKPLSEPCDGYITDAYMPQWVERWNGEQYNSGSTCNLTHRRQQNWPTFCRRKCVYLNENQCVLNLFGCNIQCFGIVLGNGWVTNSHYLKQWRPPFNDAYMCHQASMGQPYPVKLCLRCHIDNPLCVMSRYSIGWPLAWPLGARVKVAMLTPLWVSYCPRKRTICVLTQVRALTRAISGYHTVSAIRHGSGSSSYTKTKMSSFWRNFNHWLHWKLSFWQLPVQPVMKISSKWRHISIARFVSQQRIMKFIPHEKHVYFKQMGDIWNFWVQHFLTIHSNNYQELISSCNYSMLWLNIKAISLSFLTFFPWLSQPIAHPPIPSILPSSHPFIHSSIQTEALHYWDLSGKA